MKKKTFNQTTNANRKDEEEEEEKDKREPCKGSDNAGLLIRLERTHDVTVRSPLHEQGKQKTERSRPPTTGVPLTSLAALLQVRPVTASMHICNVVISPFSDVQ